MLTARAWQPENMPHKAPVGTHKPRTQSKPSSHSWVRKVFSSSIFIFSISFPFICEKQTTKCHLLLETKRQIPPKCRIFLDSWCKAKATMTCVIYSMILNVLVPALVQAALISELVIPAAKVCWISVHSSEDAHGQHSGQFSPAGSLGSFPMCHKVEATCWR